MALSETLKSGPAKIFGAFKKMEKGKKVRLIVLIALVLVIIIAITVMLNQKTYTVLYSGMEPGDTGQVLSMLSEMGVDAKSEGEDAILVPEDQADEIRLELASQGYPSSGVNDYSIYSSASGLGTTDSEKQVYYKFQLQANLSNTLEQMEKIEKAVVNLDLGEDSDFVLSDNTKPATASIVLTIRNGETLSGEEVKAVTEIVAKSVSGLETENVRIADTQSNLYTTGEEDGVQSADSKLALQQNVQGELQTQIVNLLGPVFGEDNVLAQVSVELNFDEKRTESVAYSTPAGSTDGIVVSMQELVEAITNDADGEVAGIDANGNASQYLASLDEDENAVYYNVSREVNYEIDQTTTQIEEAQGQIEKLSVSVILNSTNIDDYRDEVKALVSTAIGASPESITVDRLPFTAAEAEAEQDADEAANMLMFQQQAASSAQSAQTLRLVIVAIAAIIGFIFLFAIVKMLRPQTMEMAGGGGGFDVVIGDEEEQQQERRREEAREIEIADKDDNLAVLEEYIGKNPESVANLLRNWLNEE